MWNLKIFALQFFYSEYRLYTYVCSLCLSKFALSFPKQPISSRQNHTKCWIDVKFLRRSFEGPIIPYYSVSKNSFQSSDNFSHPVNDYIGQLEPFCAQLLGVQEIWTWGFKKPGTFCIRNLRLFSLHLQVDPIMASYCIQSTPGRTIFDPREPSQTLQNLS